MKNEMVNYVSLLSTSLSEKQLAEWKQDVVDWGEEKDEKNAEIPMLESRISALNSIESDVERLDPDDDHMYQTLRAKVNNYNSSNPDDEQICPEIDWSRTDKPTLHSGSGPSASVHGASVRAARAPGSGSVTVLSNAEAKQRVLDSVPRIREKVERELEETKARIEELVKLIDDTNQKIDNYEYEVQVGITDYVGDGVNMPAFIKEAPTDDDIAAYEVLNDGEPADKKHYYKLEKDYVYINAGMDTPAQYANYKYDANVFYKAVLSLASASYQSGNNAYDDNPMDGVPEANLSYVDYCKKILKMALASSEHKEVDVIGSDGSTYMGRVEITVDAGLSNICRNFKNKKWEDNPYIDLYMNDWRTEESWGIEYSIDPKTGEDVSVSTNNYWGNTDDNDKDYLIFQAAQTSFDFDNDTCKKYGVDFLKDDFNYEINYSNGVGSGSANVGGTKLENGSGSTSTPFAALAESEMLSAIRTAGLSSGSTLYEALASQSDGVFQDADGNEYTWSWDNLFSVFSSTSEKRYIMIYWGLSKVGSAYNQDNRFGENSFDCSSYCYRMYKKMGVDISYGGMTTAAAECEGLAAAGKIVNTDSLSSLKAGDLIFTADSKKSNGRYLGIDHVAMYVGNGMIIQATGKNYGVQYKPFKSSSASNKYYVIARPT